MTLADLVLASFLLFCRIGGCLALMPGFSSPRIPVRIRLLAAVTITLALAPIMVDDIAAAMRGTSDAVVAITVLRECLVGGLIGLLGRILFAALETLASAAAMTAGFGNAFGGRIDENDSLPELASLVMLVAVTLFFVTGQHADVVRALASSYEVLQVGATSNVRADLTQVTDMLARAFPLALQISSPLILYGLVVNFAFGLLNRLVPNIPVFFISTPFVIAGGLAMFYAIGATMMSLFAGGFGAWLARG